MPFVSHWCLSKLRRWGVARKLSQKDEKPEIFHSNVLHGMGGWIFYPPSALMLQKSFNNPQDRSWTHLLHIFLLAWFLKFELFAVQTKKKKVKKGENGWAHSPEQRMWETFTKPQKFKNITSYSSDYFGDIFCSSNSRVLKGFPLARLVNLFWYISEKS